MVIMRLSDVIFVRFHKKTFDFLTLLHMIITLYRLRAVGLETRLHKSITIWHYITKTV